MPSEHILPNVKKVDVTKRTCVSFAWLFISFKCFRRSQLYLVRTPPDVRSSHALGKPPPPTPRWQIRSFKVLSISK